MSEEFDSAIRCLPGINLNPIKWVNWEGEAVRAGWGSAVVGRAHLVASGQQLGDPSELLFRDPLSFRAGELHEHVVEWSEIIGDNPSAQQKEVLGWIQNKVSIFAYLTHFSGSFKGEHYRSDRPPARQFQNNPSCQSFVTFVQKSLLDRLRTGAISLVGRVGECEPPYLVLPLTVEPKKPRLCQDARFLNLWMVDKPFTLDKLSDLPRYVGENHYQSILDDKSGYDHVLLTRESRTYFGIQWGGWWFVYNTLPFGWKISPYVYQTTALVASDLFRSMGIPCSIYIDDRHNGQLQIARDCGAYANLSSIDEYNEAAAKSSLYIVAYYLVKMGYFLGLSKSILKPRKEVPYLGFLVDSSRQAFALIPEKRDKFVTMVRQIASQKLVSVKSLEILVGKCVSMSLAIPGALLFTREMNHAIGNSLRSGRPIRIKGNLKSEIEHWLFLESWDSPIPWRDERLIQMTITTDASSSGWSGRVFLDKPLELSDYWTTDEQCYDISIKETLALDKVLWSVANVIRNCRVDAQVDNQALIQAWNRQGAMSVELSRVIKRLFFTVTKLNISLHISNIQSAENLADGPSRRLTESDSTLHPDVWTEVEKRFGGPNGHSCDLMALDSNAMKDPTGAPLPHFNPYPSPCSHGVNVFTQDLSSDRVLLKKPYVFPPLVLVGPIVRLLKSHQLSCTLVTFETYPRKYWWPMVKASSTMSWRVAPQGTPGVLLVPSKDGWTPHPGIPGDLWVFALQFD